MEHFRLKELDIIFMKMFVKKAKFEEGGRRKQGFFIIYVWRTLSTNFSQTTL